MTLTQKIRSILHEGPATNFEVATSAGVSMQRTKALVDMLRSRGQVKRAGVIQTECGECGHARTLNLYELTQSGERLLQAKAKGKRP
jgi:predicted transcriptional regulator